MSQNRVDSETKLDEVKAARGTMREPASRISDSRSAVSQQSTFDKVMDSKKFDRIVEAILAGKYSWACLLILRFAGYNPLHYIPYRTYNRLMKNNSQQISLNQLQEYSLHKERESLAVNSAKASLDRSSYKINDLSYLEVVSQQKEQIQGGNKVYLPTNWGLWENNSSWFARQLASAAEV